MATSHQTSTMQVRLTPSGAFGGSPRRLALFYARFGFVPNEGTKRDPTCRESMHRNPAMEADDEPTEPPGQAMIVFSSTMIMPV